MRFLFLHTQTIIETLFNGYNAVGVDVRQDKLKSSRLGIRQLHNWQSRSGRLRPAAVIRKLKTFTNITYIGHDTNNLTINPKTNSLDSLTYIIFTAPNCYDVTFIIDEKKTFDLAKKRFFIYTVSQN